MCKPYKLVIEGIDGHEPLNCPVSYAFDDEDEATKALDNAKKSGLLAFLVTPLFP